MSISKEAATQPLCVAVERAARERAARAARMVRVAREVRAIRVKKAARVRRVAREQRAIRAVEREVLCGSGVRKCPISNSPTQRLLANSALSEHPTLAARVQSVVVGAGVVGLAVARSLARAGREVLVLEASSAIGSVTSSRNSGVIHAGIYYEAGSLKARTCVQGRRELYRFCEEHGVVHRRCGKLIVATDPGQLATLHALRERAEANGVRGEHEALRLLRAHEVAELEPEVRCVGGLISPSTGIVDAHELMLALQGDAEAHGATVVLNSPVTGGRVLGGGHGGSGDGGGLHAGGRLLVSTPELDLQADELVNCAGLEAARVARLLGGVPPRCVSP